MRFENCNSYNAYYKSGNDLLIECTYRDPKGKTKTETHTIKKYFSYNAATRAKLQLDYSVSSGLNIVGEYDKKQKATIFEGTEYRDIISGTKKKDIVYTGEGDDSITAGKGDDEIIINGTSPSQIKFVYINNGDGNDTIKWADNAKGIAYLVVNPADVINSEQSGRDLIITRHFQSGNAVKSETTTIVDFYDKNGNPEMYTIGDYEYSKVWVNSTPIDPSKVYNRVDYTTSTINVTQDREFAVGTKKADVVTLTSADSVIYALAGNDTINVNGGSASITSVAGGKGDDTINLNTTGNVAISHASGDGNDIVNFGNNTPSGLRINVESTLFDTYNRWTDEYMRISGKHGLIQSGNDLIYSIPTSSAFNAKTESITFKDYFAEGVHKPDTITLNLSEYDYHYGTLNGLNDGIWVEGKEKNGVTTYTGLEDFNNRYEYKGSGKAKIKGSTNTDYYNISINKNTNLYINDAGGGYSTGDYDTMFINTDYKNLRALFNMNASGKVIVSENDVYSDNFMLFDKGSLTYDNVKNIFSGKDGKGVVNIDHFFGETTDYSANGSGAIEKVFAGKNILKQYYNYESSGQNNIQEVGLTLWIEDLGMDVANWLSANTDGTKTSFEIFETGTKDEINALLKVYNTVYDKTFTT